jgi:hypothetical protein
MSYFKRRGSLEMITDNQHDTGSHVVKVRIYTGHFNLQDCIFCSNVKTGFFWKTSTSDSVAYYTYNGE